MTHRISAGQQLYINYSPRYTHLKRSSFSHPYHEGIVVQSDGEKVRKETVQLNQLLEVKTKNTRFPNHKEKKEHVVTNASH